MQLLFRWIHSLHPRTRKIGKNVAASAVYRMISMAASLVMVPVLLDWLGTTQYGIWLTIQAVVGWFMLFDLGLGNGLRNKLAEALAKDQPELARSYVSTAYAVISVIAGFLFVGFLLAGFFIDWTGVFNAEAGLAASLSATMTIVFAFFSVQFVFQLVKMILMADQRPALAGLINTVGTILALLCVLAVVKLAPGNLVLVAAIVSGTNVLVLILANFWAFGGKYAALKPSLKFIRAQHVRSLTGIGVHFFILQGAALVVFATDNMIITQLIGPEAVPAYNIAFKYFNLVMVFFTILTLPYWSAFTEAFHKSDFDWIKRTVRGLMKIWMLSLLVVAFMLLAAPAVYQIWVGDQITVPLGLSITFAVWVSLSSGIAVFSNFLSGVGKIRLSVYHAVFVMIINIPLSVWLAGPCGLGSTGVILASVLGMVPRLILQPLQYRLIISGKARGIWNR